MSIGEATLKDIEPTFAIDFSQKSQVNPTTLFN